MKTIVPSYYREFTCIADRCRHSCCIGWEIDIDPVTYASYLAMPGVLGERLRACTACTEDGQAHFVLCGEDERCPMLRTDGLCALIAELGEGVLCQICEDHPRYRNDFSDRVEIGLGLACEAAARLVLDCREPVSLIEIDDDGEEISLSPIEQRCLAVRDAAIEVLQRREQAWEVRVKALLELCGAAPDEYTINEWVQVLSDLEILDAHWVEALARVHCDASMETIHAEQLAVYLIYRHFPKMRSGIEVSALAAFAVLGCRLVGAVSAVLGDEGVVEAVRLFSSEIEYSEPNLYALLELLAEKA